MIITAGIVIDQVNDNEFDNCLSLHRSVLGTSSRGWFCQTLKQEPSCPISGPHLRPRNGTSVYLSHPLDVSPGCTTAGVWGGGSGGTTVAVGNPMSRLGFSCGTAFPHSFVAPTGSLTRTHAMHSLFETYTIESVGGGVVGGSGLGGVGATRQYATAAVRMDHVPETAGGKTDCEIVQNSRRSYLRPRRATSSYRSPDEEEGEGDEDSQTSVRKRLHEEENNACEGEEEEEEASGNRQVSGSRASYMCRKCKAHGQAVPVKRHKRACPYIQCRCLKCRLVDQGRKVVARQIALYRDQKGQANGDRSVRLTTEVNRQRVERTSSLLEQLPGSLGEENETSRLDLLPLVPQLPNAFVRSATDANVTAVGPHCRRCRNHQVAVTWKGHKKSCPYRNCPCDPCRLINVRKDTEKTLRDMAGIEEKATLQLSITSRRQNPSSFLPYLASTHSRLDIGGITSQHIEPVHLELQSAGPEQAGYNVKTRLDGLEITNSGTTFFPLPPRRTRSIQEAANDVSTGSSGDGGSLIDSDCLQRSSHRRPDTHPPQDLYHIDEMGTQSVTSPPLNCDTDNRSLNLEASSTSPSLGNNPLTEFSDSLTAAATYSQHHRSSSELFYYDSLPETRKHLQEEKTTPVPPPPPRTMLPFWQSFGHLETEKTSEMLSGTTPSYLGGGTAAAAALYYPGSMHGGHVFHGSTGSHMYSPERVSAVAAAAAAAAAMVAMTPPINNAYPQACYGQNRGGFYPTQFPPSAEQTYGCMNGETIDYGGPNGSFRDYPYAPRLLQGPERESERPRLSGGRSDHWSSGYGWGAYRYPYMMRNLPLSATSSTPAQYQVNESENETVIPRLTKVTAGGNASNMNIAKDSNHSTVPTDKSDPTDDTLPNIHEQASSNVDETANTVRNTRNIPMRHSQIHQLSLSRLNSAETNFKVPVTCTPKNEEQMDKGKPGPTDLVPSENADQSLNALRTARGVDDVAPLNATIPEVGPEFSLSSFPSAYSSRRFFADTVPPPPPQLALPQAEEREIFGRTSDAVASPTRVIATEAFFPPRGLQDFRDQRHQHQQHRQHEDVDVVETKLSPVKVLDSGLSETFHPPSSSTSSTARDSLRSANHIFVTSTQDTNPPTFLAYARPPLDGALRVG
ncbi:hypothetical protein AAHC03_05009 [Spirometra sp. Aus1]